MSTHQTTDDEKALLEAHQRLVQRAVSRERARIHAAFDRFLRAEGIECRCPAHHDELKPQQLSPACRFEAELLRLI